MTLQEKIQDVAEGFGHLAPLFLAGAKFALNNQWISVNEDLPCNHDDLILTYNDKPFSTKRVLVISDNHTLFLCEMKKDNNHGWIWNISTKDKRFASGTWSRILAANDSLVGYNLNYSDFEDMEEGEIREVFLNLED